MILFLTNCYPDFPGAYRGHFVRELAQGAARFGYPVVVVTPRVFYRSPLTEIELEGGTEIFRFRYPSGNRQLLHFKKIPYLRMIVFLLSGLVTTLKIVRSRACELIHAHWVVPTGFLGVVVGHILGIPVVVHARGTDMHTYANRGVFLRLITAWTLKKARTLIAASHEMKKVMVEDFQIPAPQINVIPTGIDTTLFSPLSENQADPGFAARRRVRLIYVGGLYPSKGIEHLLKAVEPLFRGNPELHLTLVGEGPLEADIMKWARHHGFQKTVELTGPLPHDQIPQKLRQSHLFILPSLKEGTPNSLLEAMACGLPSIATKVGEIPSIIEDGVDGLLVMPGSSGELAASIELLLGDTALYKKIAENCRHKALKYSQEKSLKKIIKIYRELSG